MFCIVVTLDVSSGGTQVNDLQFWKVLVIIVTFEVSRIGIATILCVLAKEDAKLVALLVSNLGK
jgi:hypothetical protein